MANILREKKKREHKLNVKCVFSQQTSEFSIILRRHFEKCVLMAAAISSWVLATAAGVVSTCYFAISTIFLTSFHISQQILAVCVQFSARQSACTGNVARCHNVEFVECFFCRIQASTKNK